MGCLSQRIWLGLEVARLRIALTWNSARGRTQDTSRQEWVTAGSFRVMLQVWILVQGWSSGKSPLKCHWAQSEQHLALPQADGQKLSVSGMERDGSQSAAPTLVTCVWGTSLLLQLISLACCLRLPHGVRLWAAIAKALELIKPRGVSEHTMFLNTENSFINFVK